MSGGWKKSDEGFSRLLNESLVRHRQPLNIFVLHTKLSDSRLTGMHMKSGFGMTSRGYRFRDDGGQRGRSTSGRPGQPYAGEPRRPFSFYAAVKVTFVLSLLLWWLPLFGQMIAGYVGGRKAGSPNRGMLAAMIPVGLFSFMIYGADVGLLPHLSFLCDSNGPLIAAFSEDIPALGAIMTIVVGYLESFLAAVGNTTSLQINSYIITVAFAYVGGILAEQNRNEMDYVRQYAPPVARSAPRASFESFDECMPVKGRAVRGDSAKNSRSPRRAHRNTASESTFSGLFHRAEANDPNKDRPASRSQRDDWDYV